MGRTTKIGRRLLLGAMIGQFLCVASAGAQVQLTETTVTIPTYGYAQALYVPDPWDRAYPYTKFDLGAVAASPTDRTYTAVVMENAYLKVVILPEIGGRIYEVRFKPTGELVFYMNDVIKPFYAGPRRGGWLAIGGLEYCFPTTEHALNTCSPWQYVVSRGRDGSGVVTVSDDERKFGMRISVDIVLRPLSSALALRPKLYNPNPLRNRYQCWINAFMGTSEGIEFIYPTRTMVVHGGWEDFLPAGKSVIPWPIYRGVDLRWYRNWKGHAGFFAKDHGAGFIASYDHATDQGIVHTFPPDKIGGLKLFSYGTRDTVEGFWGTPEHYTDHAGSYFEMWDGVFETFWDNGFLGPFETYEWEEVWYPVRGIGGVKAANRTVALNLATSEGSGDSVRVEIGAASNRPLDGPRLALLREGEEIRDWWMHLRPDQPLYEVDWVDVKEGERLDLVVQHVGGGEWLRCSSSLMPKEGGSGTRPGGAEAGTTEVDSVRTAVSALKAAVDTELGNGHERSVDTDKVIGRYGDVLDLDPKNVDALVGLGVTYLKRYDFERAREVLRKAVKRDRKNREARWALSQCEEPKKAVGVLKKGIKGDGVGEALLGRLLFKRGRFGEAAEHLHRARTLNRNDVETGLWLARALEETGDIQGAISVLTDVLRLDPAHEGAMMLLSRLYRAQGETEAGASGETETPGDIGVLQGQAESYVQQVQKLLGNRPHEWLGLGLLLKEIGTYEEAKHALDRCLSVSSGNGVALAAMGNIYMEMGDSTQAFERYTQIDSLNVGQQTPHGRAALQEVQGALEQYPRSAALHHLLGMIYAGADHADAAIRAWETAVSIDSTLAPAHLLLGLAYTSEKGDKEAGGRALHHAGRHAPEDARMLRRLGEMLIWDLGKPAEGLPYLEQSAELQPGNPSLYLSLGWAYVANRRYDEALRSFDVGEEASEGEAQWGRSDVYTYKGDEAYEAGDFAQAATYYERSLAYAPDRLTERNKLGLSYQRMGEMDKARAQWQMVIGRLRDRGTLMPWDRYALAGAWEAMGDRTEARTQFEKLIEEGIAAAERWERWGGVHFFIGKGYEKTGRINQAREEYRKALELEPNHLEAKRALEALEGK